MEIPRTAPRDFIFPLVSLNAQGEADGFLGTSFAALRYPIIITAAHIVSETRRMAIVDTAAAGAYYETNVIAVDRMVDLAVLEAPGIPQDRTILALGDSDTLGFGTDIKTFEFSDSRIHGGDLVTNPATRKGYATRKVIRLNGGLEAFELSFPALLGSSGAPVINEWDGKVYAVIIASAAYHLLPAQIETVLDADNEILEEQKFLLPQSLAVPINDLERLGWDRE